MTAIELPRARNRRASASFVVGLIAVAIVQIAIAASRFFDEIPDALTLGGAALIVAGTLILVLHGRRGRGIVPTPE